MIIMLTSESENIEDCFRTAVRGADTGSVSESSDISRGGAVFLLYLGCLLLVFLFLDFWGFSPLVLACKVISVSESKGFRDALKWHNYSLESKKSIH